MKIRIPKLMLICVFCVSATGYGATKGVAGTQLSEAITSFNKESRSDSIGASQTPITVEEVVAAILLWERPASAPVSDELLASFKKIASFRILPDNASFESLTGYDRGGTHVFDVWSVRIRMERADGSSYAFVIRERAVGARTLKEELGRLNALIEEKEVERWVGGHRILERKRALETRIKATSQ